MVSDDPSGASKVVKVRPYPIAAQLKGEVHELKGNVVKLTQIGFLIECEVPLKVGSRYQVRFEIPVYHHLIETEMVVIKTHDEFRGSLGDQRNYRLAELHFKNLSVLHLKFVTDFLRTIQQVHGRK